MKKTGTFYILLILKDLQFLAENSFTELPFNKIPFTLTREQIIQYAEKVKDDSNGIFITAKVECDTDRFTEYRDSDSAENLTEFGRFSQAITETINSSLSDKIKLEDVFGKDFRNEDCAEVKTIIDEEMYFFKRRMEIFLETHSREIIPPDFLKTDAEEYQEPKNFTDEEVRQQIEKTLAEEAISAERIKDETKKVNTVEEAVDYLIEKDLSLGNLNHVKNISCAARLDFLKGDSDFHFGLGMYLRNIFFYGNDNQEFYKDLENYKSHIFFNHGEFGEGIIYDLLWRKLNHCITTRENKEKINEIREQLKTETNADSLWISDIKIMMLSYNFSNEEIEKYLDLERKSDHDKGNFYEFYYQQKAVLARLNDDEKETFEMLKQDYFNVRKIMDKLTNTR
ncbi:hypothetical protein [uncultured Chryseobacterium sp.]|uniref:hypothetical protein n=1 Tax=uncultured Chryseobacterium sp. TaxID=259322 RepID=UPI0025D28ADD|nr:hypothetical protein [uncultured Chryseobacterium sp.]